MLGGFGGSKDVLVRWETCDVRKEGEEKYDREAGNWSAFVWVFVYLPTTKIWNLVLVSNI